MKTDEIYALLEARRLELGLSQVQVGQLAFGRPDSSAIQNLKRGSSPTYERLEAVAKALGLELYLGPKRPDVTEFREDAEPMHVAKVNAPEGGIYLPLPWHPLARKRGPTPLAFHGVWLEAVNIDPERLALVDPSVVHLDVGLARNLLLVVDTGAERKMSPQIWSFIERGQVAVGLVQFDGDAVLILPVRSGEPVRILRGKEKEATPFLGRVVWRCHIEIDGIGAARRDTSDA